MANDGDTPVPEFSLLGAGVEGFAFAVADNVIGGRFRKASHPVVIADENIHGHPGEHVEEARGMLRHATVDVGHSLLAMAGELLGQINEVRFLYSGNFRPLGEPSRAGSFTVPRRNVEGLPSAVSFTSQAACVQVGSLYAAAAALLALAR
jgi:hypothetical protein